jgi:hypothetical protein
MAGGSNMMQSNSSNQPPYNLKGNSIPTDELAHYSPRSNNNVKQRNEIDCSSNEKFLLSKEE